MIDSSVPIGVLHSFSIKNIFYGEMDSRLFYFHVTIDILLVSMNFFSETLFKPCMILIKREMKGN